MPTAYLFTITIYSGTSLSDPLIMRPSPLYDRIFFNGFCFTIWSLLTPTRLCDLLRYVTSDRHFMVVCGLMRPCVETSKNVKESRITIQKEFRSSDK